MGARKLSMQGLAAGLLGTRAQSPEITAQLVGGLFTSVPIFLGGIVNTIAVAVIAAARHPTAAFIGWLAFEVALGALRLAVLLNGRSALAAGEQPPRLTAALLACAWAASLGYGTFICLVSGDWVLSTIACLSTAAMVCGICLRNYGTPRLVAVMVFLALAPCAVAGLLTDDPVVPIISAQLPVFFITILAAASSLHRMLVSRMIAFSDLQQSESLNDIILSSSPDYTLILDADDRIVFCNRPMIGFDKAPIGLKWLPLVSDDHRETTRQMLKQAQAGRPNSIMLSRFGDDGQKQWFHIIAQPVADDSGRVIVVARDITHQKKSEERAIWMAQHDTLTGLPNRALLQDRLDAMLAAEHQCELGALLLLDVDNFKSINDTLGHDGGDALLCAFADRLRAAAGEGDLVARTGGDEFALIVEAASDAEVERVARRIFAQLGETFSHRGRQFECCASIGATFIRRADGDRSEIMKAADIALYAAKAGGRAQMKIFEPAMMEEVERHQKMIVSARQALQRGAVVPHYQPKVSLRNSQITGFEALLRWRDRDERLQDPEGIMAAFDDPTLGAMLSDRMLDKVLGDIAEWCATGVEFGHVAINVAAGDFKRAGFVDAILSQLDARQIPPLRLQIEVTETVFLGKGADEVEDALKRLSDRGIRIALDDFGTGYASLSHLNQFPVDLLKIDRSFIAKIGMSADAEAITAAVVNLGHCLGLEVIAEGIETQAQERHLIGMGCDTGQGFLYASALAAEDVPGLIAGQVRGARRA